MPTFSHVFILVMENEESTSLIGNASAPYINGLANSYGLAIQYYGVSHPSLPNYLAPTAGSTFGISSDCTTCWLNATNVADQIEASGRSWKAYLEGMPSACSVGDSYPYMQKHNPLIYFNDIRTNAARRGAHVAPFTQLGIDLGSGSVPNYVWITPNITLAELVREAVDAYLADRSLDPAATLNSTFGALPKLEVPSRDEWDRA